MAGLKPVTPYTLAKFEWPKMVLENRKATGDDKKSISERDFKKHKNVICTEECRVRCNIRKNI